MAHWLLFGPAGRLTAELTTKLVRGEASDLPASEQVRQFRRDVIASDPDWTAMTLLPRPRAEFADRYLALVFGQPPAPDQVRDLRYVAARNGLDMAEYREPPTG